MLDIYYILDAEENPIYPDESKYLGQWNCIDLKTLNNDKFFLALGIDIHLHEDSRIKRNDVETLLDYFQKKYLVNTFTSILLAALKRKAGIMIFCD